jgi:predicted dehydrogenase
VNRGVVNSLVIGYGSIGARHAGILEELGSRVAVVSRRPDAAHITVFGELGQALQVHAPGYVVIANETGLHRTALEQLGQCGYRGTVLVEKPLFSATASIPENAFGALRIAYNLRFHPIILRLKALLEGEQVVSANVYVGQYLPDWRPGTDYRQSYSALPERGGGVLRDLSHELDYLTWMLGGWNSVAALGGHFSAIEVTSDDVFSLLMTTPRCRAASVHLNYLERIPKRLITINTNRHTLQADLVKGTLAVDGDTEMFQTERNGTYRAMHAAVLAGQNEVACSLEEGIETLLLIDAAYTAAQTRKWIDK